MKTGPFTRAMALRSRLGRRLLTLALLVAACAPATSPAPALDSSPEPIRAMTFNIRYGTARDGEHAWPLRRELAIGVIREFAPAVLGVQEALRFQLDEIGTALPAYAEIGVGRDDGREQGEYSAILYDRGRLELLDSGTFWLSDTPAVPGSMTWGNRFARLATWARFRDRDSGGDTFFVFNTHWDHESQPSRERSAALILGRIRAREPSDPALLMGDFNAGEDNPAFLALVSPASPVLLYDTFRRAHPRAVETGTYHAFRGDRSGPKIDAILASPEWRTLDAQIVLPASVGRYPSDHFPVTAILELQLRSPPD